MASLISNRKWSTKARSAQRAVEIADGVTVRAGGLIQLKNGFAEPWDQTGQLLGLMTSGDADPNTGLFTGSANAFPIRECRVDTSGLTIVGLDLSGDSVTKASVGTEVFCPTDNLDDLTTVATENGVPVGKISAYRSATHCNVELYPADITQLNIVATSVSTGSVEAEEVAATNLAVDVLSVPDGGASAARIAVGNATSGDLRIYHDGSQSVLYNVGSPLWAYTATAHAFSVFTNNTLALSVSGSNQLVTCSKGLTVNTTAASSALVVSDANGRVGIGIAAPDEELHVYGSANVFVRAQATSAASTSGFQLRNDSLIWGLYLQGSSGNQFALRNETGSLTPFRTSTSGSSTLNSSSASGGPTLTIDQDDADEPFVDFAGTSAASSAANISTWTTGATLTGYVRVAINGTDYWMPYYTAPTS